MLTEEEKKKIAEEEKIRLKTKQNEEFKQGGIGCLVLIGIIVLVLVFTSFNCSRESKIFKKEPGLIETGSQAILDNGGENVILGTDKKDYNSILDACNAKDQIGLDQLIMQGKAFMVKCKTKILVIDHGFGITKVRILEGEQAALSGWAASEFVKKE